MITFRFDCRRTQGIGSMYDLRLQARWRTTAYAVIWLWTLWLALGRWTLFKADPKVWREYDPLLDERLYHAYARFHTYGWVRGLTPPWEPKL